MDVSRRTLLSGGVIGAVTAGGIGYSLGVFDPYESDVWVTNRRETSVAIDLELSNLDAGRTVLDESFTVSPDDSFQERGVFSNHTTYRLTVQADDDSTERKFDTCCEGYSVSVWLYPDDTQVGLGHHDS